MIQNLFSAGVSAGTIIQNTAYLDYVVESVTFQAKSNELINIVDQKLDMTMVCQESASVIVGVAEKKRAMGFILTNSGNGEDVYAFTPIEGQSVDFSVANTEVYQDDGDGIFSLANDTLVTEITLGADGNVSLFLVSDIPADAKNFSINGIKASSNIQGSLVYGEFKKLDDFYAVVATKEEAKSAMCSYEVSNLALELEKTATLSSDKLYKGSTIHYDIAVKVIGTGKLDNVVVKDTIPEGTVYVPETLKLNGIAVGDFNGTAFSVALNTIEQVVESSDPVHRVTFDVRVQ